MELDCDHRLQTIISVGSRENVAKLFTTKSRFLTTLRNRPLENIVGKGENAGNQHFLLFPQCFLPFPKRILTFQPNLICLLQMLSTSTSLKICCLVKS